MNYALILFIGCTFANVVISTIKSVMTIKGNKFSAAFWNAIAFGLYTYIVILTATAPVSTIWKVAITMICNLVGVFCVKLVEEKLRKDKMWKIDMTIKINYPNQADLMHKHLTAQKIPNNFVIAGTHAIFNCYCQTKKDSERALRIGKHYGAKTFATETALAP